MTTARAATPDIGSVLADRYELVRHIARGGMGDVFEAIDRQLSRSVAVKLFRGAAASDRARFAAEAVVLASLNHPGLVHIYDAGDHDGDAFVVLELIEGPTLAARLATDGPLPSTDVAAVGAAVADALAFVHESGVVHRDVTPANVLCGSDGRPRLADFGIARLVDTTRVTATATAIGTAAYMAPEQVQGHDVTPAADVYALGLVLLELLTGRKGFTGSSQEMAVARLARDPDTTTGVPGAWRPLLSDMTARTATERPSAGEVRDRLTSQLAGLDAPTGAIALAPAAVTVTDLPAAGTAVMPVTLLPEPTPARPNRRRAILAATAALAIGLGGAAAMNDDGPFGAVPDPTTTVTPVPTTTTTVTPTTAAPPTTTPAATTPTDDEDRDRPGKDKERDRADEEDD